MSILNRRVLMVGVVAGAALALAGCVSTNPSPVVEAAAVPPPLPSAPAAESPMADPPVAKADLPPADPSPKSFAALYGPVKGEPFQVPGLKPSDIKPAFIRKTVDYVTKEAPGTIVIDPAHHYLYLVQDGGKAIRYGVGVGRQGFAWSGTATINSKQEWPDWYPPKEMIERQPELRTHLAKLQSGIGVKGGPTNPLGARAMYLWQDNKDTLYRIHGTTEPHSIGKSVSSGCIRMIDQDVIDLYNRVQVGTKVVVIPASVAETETRRPDHGHVGMRS